MAPLTVQASVLSNVRLVGAQARNVRSRGAARAQRMAVRPASAAAETEAVPEAAPEAAPVEAAEAAEAPQQQQQQQRKPRGGGKRQGPGPARTFQVSAIEVGKEYDGAIVAIREFGAFVNVGANNDGLLHISQISTGFVRNVADSVEVGQAVRVRVLSVDLERNKFAVTMIPEGAEVPPRGERGERDYEAEGGERPQLKQQARAAKQQKPRGERRAAPPVSAGDSIKGKVAGTAAFGVFVEIAEGFTGLLHESEQRREEGASPLAVGDEVEVVVVSVRGDKVALSQRSAEEIEQEKKLAVSGVSSVAELAPGSGLLAQQLARAGISADQYQAAVGSA